MSATSVSSSVDSNTYILNVVESTDMTFPFLTSTQFDVDDLL